MRIILHMGRANLLTIRQMTITALFGITLSLAQGCARTQPRVEAVEASASRAEQQAAQKVQPVVTGKLYKRKIAIGRFSNETQYGKLLLMDRDNDPLSMKAGDMLASRLVASQRFLIFERPDIEEVSMEQQRIDETGLIGVDTLIMGSITEFGRTAQGTSGFFSSTKKQIVRAKVDIRLVDVKTGHAYFSGSGTGQATTESGTTAGFGNQAGYDARLNDQAIGAAISDVVNKLVSRLEARTWQTDILSHEGNVVFISGGERQGLAKGDRLIISKLGKLVKSGQSGFSIRLPGSQAAIIEIESFFGDSESTEGSQCRIVEGEITASEDMSQLSVIEQRR